jgi:hypothetical protein
VAGEEVLEILPVAEAERDSPSNSDSSPKNCPAFTVSNTMRSPVESSMKTSTSPDATMKIAPPGSARRKIN